MTFKSSACLNQALGYLILFIKRGILATNSQLVEKVVRLTDEFEREIATPDEVREMLGLKGKEAVKF